MSTLPVAVDAMGGDHAPERNIAAAVAAASEGANVLLVGDPDRLGDDHGLPVHPASEVIPMDADPATAVRRYKDSSVVRCAELVRDGVASSMLSAGNTGAAMASSLLRMGRIKGIARPAIAIPFPVDGRHPCVLLDCGANAECQPEWLVQFGQMGAVYSRVRFGIDQPRVGVLTIGEEAGKGNSLVKETVALMEAGGWEDACGAVYGGNIEGRDLMVDVAEVAVCDGFTGNVVLKSLEGGVGSALDRIRAAMQATPEAAAAAAILEPYLDPVFDVLDVNNTGSALLLGVRGVSMISHGSSSVHALTRGIHTAESMVAEGIVEQLRDIVGS